jgi:hypothetical protein
MNNAQQKDDRSDYGHYHGFREKWVEEEDDYEGFYHKNEKH